MSTNHEAARFNVLSFRTALDHERSQAVPVDRRSRWGNPFRMEDDSEAERQRVVQLYRQWLWDSLRSGHIDPADLRELHGRDLICWCAPQLCHAEVLVSAAHWVAKETNPQGYWDANCFLCLDERGQAPEIGD